MFAIKESSWISTRNIVTIAVSPHEGSILPHKSVPCDGNSLTRFLSEPLFARTKRCLNSWSSNSILIRLFSGYHWPLQQYLVLLHMIGIQKWVVLLIFRWLELINSQERPPVFWDAYSVVPVLRAFLLTLFSVLQWKANKAHEQQKLSRSSYRAFKYCHGSQINNLWQFHNRCHQEREQHENMTWTSAITHSICLLFSLSCPLYLFWSCLSLPWRVDFKYSSIPFDLGVCSPFDLRSFQPIIHFKLLW